MTVATFLYPPIQLRDLCREIIDNSWTALKDDKTDVHSQLMKRYRTVPQSWFLILLVISLILSLVVSIVWEDDVQLVWWGVLLACGIAAFFTLPIGIITATTNQVYPTDPDFPD